MSYTFTVTQTQQNFTATIGDAITLTLTEDPDTVNVVNSLNTITIVRVVQPITVSGATGQGGSSFNQSLNTTDNVAFSSLTTPVIYGTGGQPVFFPTGINATNLGTTFAGTLDMGSISGTLTNQFSLLFALLPLDFGTIQTPSPYSLQF